MGEIVTSKRIITFILIIGVLVAIFIYADIFSITSDYTWSKSIIERKSSQGWSLVVKQHDDISYKHIWTLVNTPVTSLWFTHIKQIRTFDKYVIAPIIRFNYIYDVGISQSEGVAVVSTGQKALALIFNEKVGTIKLTELKKLKFLQFSIGTPGDQITGYLLKYKN